MPRPATNSKRIHLYIPVPQLDRLQSIASGAGLTQSEVIRRALTYFLSAVDKQKASNKQ